MDFTQNNGITMSSDFPQNNVAPIMANDFSQNNGQPIITNNFPQNYNQPMMNNGYDPNFNNFNNFPQGNNNPPLNPNDFPYQNSHHINNYGYFFIMPNNFMNLESQQKIVINTAQIGFSPKRFAVVMFFFILFAVGGVLTGLTQGAAFPIIIIAFIGFAVSSAWSAGAFRCCSSKNFVYYNTNNKNLEIHCSKKINNSIDSIDKIVMEDNNKGSIFYIITKSGEKTEFLKLPLVMGVPFKEGELILNDFIEYWKKKEGLSHTPL